MTNIDIVTVEADTETILNVHPFSAQNPARAESVAGATIYGVLLPAKTAQSGLYQWWQGDGVKTVWTANEIINLANADNVLTGITDRLAVVVIINGKTVLKRVAEGATPGTGEFKVADNAGTNEITFGDTYADGTKIEMFLTAEASITNTVVPAGGVPKRLVCPQVVVADAELRVSRLTV